MSAMLLDRFVPNGDAKARARKPGARGRAVTVRRVNHARTIFTGRWDVGFRCCRWLC